MRCYFFYFLFFCLTSKCFGDSSVALINKSQICYLMQAKEVSASINLYNQYQNQLGKHDFEVLQQMAFILLEEGAKSEHSEQQLLSIFGSAIANVSSSLDVLEAGIKSEHPETQIASIQFLGRIHEDRSDELLIKAMSSNFLYARMEAAYHLAERKHPASVGQIEALMYRIPPPYRFFFPQFFALIGTADAISILRHLIEDRYDIVRVEAILNVARFGRDDLLPVIRSAATHLNMAEQEACAYALGVLKDTKSLPKLRKMMGSSSLNVQLAAARALCELGDSSAKEVLIQNAKSKNLFAISTIASCEGSQDLLCELIKDPDLQVRINAAIALIQRRDARAKNAILELLIRDSRDLGFIPQVSLGRSLFCWKVLSSAKQHQKEGLYDIEGYSIQLRENLLRESIELPEKDFLFIADKIFESKQSELVPHLVSLIENLQTEDSVALLKEKAETAGGPLIRAYCNLALFRLNKKGPYAQNLKNWITTHKKSDMIRFRPMAPIDQRRSDSALELTPEDHSRLLVDSYQALADRHDENSIELILEGIKEGNPKNRYVLAGLLIRALQ